MSLRSEPHPISGARYDELGDGRVRVTDAHTGAWGLFRADGAWIEGEITHADPHLLGWVGGPALPAASDTFWTMLPPSPDSPHPAGGGNPGREAQGAQNRLVAPYTGDPGGMTDEGMRSSSHIPQDYFLDNDRRPDRVPEVYRLRSPMPGGPTSVPAARFVQQRYHDLEVARLWSRTWQMACREDDIPDVGDFHIYRIASTEYLIVRTGADSFVAHLNACPHRGRALRDCDGRRAREFRCPFHGWSWTIDGRLKEITTEWDFPGLREQVGQLPGAQVATWGGFIFINPDPDAEPLDRFMGPEMLAHYAGAELDRRYKHVHVARVICANWKVVMEAFLEAYHTVATHPQLLLSGGDCADTRYDVFGNWARLGHAGMTVSSPQRGMIAPAETALAAYHKTADANRAYLRQLIGDEAEDYCDAELVEQSFNNLFPNFSPWGGLARVVYRFRPHGDDPHESIMDVMFLAPWPKDKPKPAAAPVHALGRNDSWTEAPELGMLARILDQDCANLAAVQRGLKGKRGGHVWYSAYQESVIRNFHRNYAAALGLEDGE